MHERASCALDKYNEDGLVRYQFLCLGWTMVTFELMTVTDMCVAS
jgi:hypothetical protein